MSYKGANVVGSYISMISKGKQTIAEGGMPLPYSSCENSPLYGTLYDRTCHAAISTHHLGHIFSCYCIMSLGVHSVSSFTHVLCLCHFVNVLEPSAWISPRPHEYIFDFLVILNKEGKQQSTSITRNRLQASPTVSMSSREQ